MFSNFRVHVNVFLVSFFFILIIFGLTSQIAIAQETSIKGKVTDANSNQPIPFANIKLKGIATGISTDFEGNYSIKTNSRIDSIQASYLGYKSKTKKVKFGVNQTIDFQLQGNSVGIKEVIVLAGENPAITVIRNAQKSRDAHNKNNLPFYQFSSYTKMQVDVDNVSERLRKRKLLRPVTSLFDSLEVEAGEEGDLHMPVFYSENLSDVYFTQTPFKRKKEIIKASKINAVGIRSGMVTSQFTGSTFEEYNFNQNKLNIFNKEFLSPIADNALFFYDFYLTDTVIVANTRCFLIKVKPKNKKDLLFTGNIWITDSTWAIKQVNLEIPKTVNINFIDRIQIQQELIPLASGAWVASKSRLIFDFADVSNKLVGLIARIYNAAYNFNETETHETIFYETPIVLKEEALVKDDNYWVNNRPEPISPTDVYVYNMIDSIKSIPIVKVAVSSFYTFATGHFTINKIDYGTLLSLVSYNNIEGYKYKFGGRTNYLFSDRWIYRAYLAYGEKDQKFKYNIQAEYLLSRKQWTKIGMNRREDIDQVGNSFKFDDSEAFNGQESLLYNTTSQLNRFAFLIHKIENRVWIISEYKTGLTGRFTFQNIAYKNYLTNSNDSVVSSLQRDFTSTEFIFEARYAHNEVHVVDDNRRYRIGNSKLPVVTLGFKLGVKGVLKSDFDYSSIYFTVSHRLKLGFLGYSRMILDGGKTFTSVPYSLLEVHRGNQTPFFAYATFNMMNYFEFISDEFVSFDYVHHFEGLILNRIPLINKLKWREIVTFRAVYGTLSKHNQNPLVLNTFSTLTNKPYMEAGFGLLNILKLLRVDFIYRLNYNNDAYLAQYKQLQINNGVTNPYSIDRFAVKFSLQFSF